LWLTDASGQVVWEAILMKTYKRWMWFLGTIYFPFLFGSVFIGWVVGYGGQKLALILGLHQTNQQNEMVFWFFFGDRCRDWGNRFNYVLNRVLPK